MRREEEGLCSPLCTLGFIGILKRCCEDENDLAGYPEGLSITISLTPLGLLLLLLCEHYMAD